jgi:hypothetical protein
MIYTQISMSVPIGQSKKCRLIGYEIRQVFC